jgi:hypothetical protein
VGAGVGLFTRVAITAAPPRGRGIEFQGDGFGAWRPEWLARPLCMAEVSRRVAVGADDARRVTLSTITDRGTLTVTRSEA